MTDHDGDQDQQTEHDQQHGRDDEGQKRVRKVARDVDGIPADRDRTQSDDERQKRVRKVARDVDGIPAHTDRTQSDDERQKRVRK